MTQLNLDSERSKRFLQFARSKLAQIKDMDLPSKALKVDGYTIQVKQSRDYESIRITAPPGAVVVDFTDGNYNYRYADQFGADFALLKSWAAADNIIPLTLFSSPSDFIYEATTDLDIPDHISFTFGSSSIAYDPNSSIRFDDFGHAEITDRNNTRPLLGFSFMRNGVLYTCSTKTQIDRTGSDNSGDDINTGDHNLPTFWVTKGFVSSASPNNTPMGSYFGPPSGPWDTAAFFMRPIWGENAALAYVFAGNQDAESNITIDIFEVRMYRIGFTNPLNITVEQVGVIPRSVITSGADYVGILLWHWANTAPLPPSSFTTPGNPGLPPFPRGMIFSYDVDAVCVLGYTGPPSAYNTGTIGGVIFRPDGTVTKTPMALPAYDVTQFYARVVEVSPGFYRCEIVGCFGTAASAEIHAVYYGSPLGAGSWVELIHPIGVLLRHRTIQATADHIIALAIVYDGTNTVLYSHDSRQAAGWFARGKIGSGKITHPDVAIFGSHEYAAMASADSPVEWLWHSLSREQ